MKDALKVWQCLSIIWFFFFFFGKFCLCARCLSLFWEESPPSAILLSILWSDLWLYYLGDKMKDEMKSMKRQSFQYILLLLKVKKKKVLFPFLFTDITRNTHPLGEVLGDAQPGSLTSAWQGSLVVSFLVQRWRSPPSALLFKRGLFSPISFKRLKSLFTILNEAPNK